MKRLAITGILLSGLTLYSQVPVRNMGYSRKQNNTVPVFTSMLLRLPFSEFEKEYQVSKEGHNYILNGDIVVGNDLPKIMSVSVVNNLFWDYRWPNATIPAVVDVSVYDQNLGSVVHDAIRELNSKTELCIIPRTTENDYIRIVFDSTIAGGGLSPVGRQGGQQVIRISAGAGAGTVMHEVLHSAGFYHEQSRPDRDNYVRIRSENIMGRTLSNFQQEPGIPRGQYDYCSIMHYSATAFSSNGLPTIECIVDGKVVPCSNCMGNRSSLTDLDIQGIDAFYDQVSRFPCQTSFPWPNPDVRRFLNIYPSAAQSAMAAFRYRADMAPLEGFVGGFPNFHEARQGANIVGGTIFLNNLTSLWRDVSLSMLGNPPLDDFAARMRATQDYAVRNGFVGGFPNFHQVTNASGRVDCGTILISSAGADWKDVSLSELGNPPLNDIGARFRSANDYAFKNGYLGGFPTFYHADYGNGIVCGIILIKKEAGIWKDVIITQGPR